MERLQIAEWNATWIGLVFLNRFAQRFKIGRWYGWCVHNFLDVMVKSCRRNSHELLASCCAAKLRVVSQVSGAAMARPNLAQGKLSCESSRRPSGGIAAATVRPLPGHCADMTRDISPDFLPDVSRPSRDHLAGLRTVFGELLASRKNLVQTRVRLTPV
jgi:hypothetical protein